MASIPCMSSLNVRRHVAVFASAGELPSGCRPTEVSVGAMLSMTKVPDGAHLCDDAEDVACHVLDVPNAGEGELDRAVG